MQTGNTNILDQLLGGFGPQPTGATGTSGESAQSNGVAGVFDALLAQAAKQPNANTEAAPPAAHDLFPSLDQSVASDKTPTDQTVLIAAPGTLIEAVNGTGTAKAIESLPAGVTGQTTTEDADLPLPSLTNSSLQQLLNKDRAGSASIQSGTYCVMDQEMSGRDLELTVAHQDSLEEPVKITLPAELLKSKVQADGSFANRNNMRSARISLDATVAKAESRIDELLNKLNIKELKIDAPTGTNRPTAKMADQMVGVELVAEQSGQAVVIKSRLGLKAIRVDHGSRTGGKAVNNGQPMILSGDDGINLQKISPADRIARQQILGNPAKLMQSSQKSSGSELNQTDIELLQPGFASDEIAERSAAQSAPKILPTVKLSLPQPVLKSFSASGQTLMLQIEPEQLGPARLHLSLHDGLLTARVIVDSPLAKMAVENSLDQLTDQLSRAGVDVDKINVSLSDSYAQERFFDRRPAWSFNQQNRRYDNENTSGSVATHAVAADQIINSQFVGTQGVNLLA